MKKIFLTGFVILFLAIVNTAIAAEYIMTPEFSGLPEGVGDWVFDGNETTARSNNWPGDDWLPVAGSNAIWTWYDNTWVEYKYHLTPGLWNIGINVIDNTWIPPSDDEENPYYYPEFIVSVTGMYTDTFYITESDTEVYNDYFPYTVRVDDEDDYTVRYLWTNGYYIENIVDTNIEIRSAFFDKVSNVPIPGTVLLLGSGLVGIVGLRRKLVKD